MHEECRAIGQEGFRAQIQLPSQAAYVVAQQGNPDLRPQRPL